MYPNKILIVEDDPLWQSFLQEPLEDEYALTVVSTRSEAKDALDKAKSAGRPFELVTVDIGLENDAPTLDGEALLDFVNKHHRRTKCIVVTGHQSVGMAQLRDYFTKFEVFDYVGKADFDLDHFKEVVDRVFYKHGYRILAELGRGGMGTVYQALHPNDKQRVVALKVLHTDSSIATKELERRLARFRKEVETARRLVHPNIVKVLDVAGEEESKSQLFFAMEYLQGQTLQEVLAGNDPLSEETVINVGYQLCDALSYAHKQQIVHRDIKPSNIILLPDGRIKITDFGIAKVLNVDSSLTKTEDIVGTLEYMPPEQILNAKAVDPRVDIYAVGAVLYELLSRQRMYSDPMKKLQYDPTPLHHLKPNLPGWLVKAVMKAVDREPDHRFQTAADMARVLKEQKDKLQ